jgi:hypothetical protein
MVMETDLEVFMNLHIFSTPEYKTKYWFLECCLCVWMYTLLVLEWLAYFINI